MYMNDGNKKCFCSPFCRVTGGRGSFFVCAGKLRPGETGKIRHDLLKATP
jgi:hypothetical protein